MLLAIGAGRLAQSHASWRTPVVVCVGLAAILPVIALVGGVVDALRDNERTPTRDALTGYRAAALAIDAIPDDGAVLGAWQSGAVGYYADDRFTVVNLDGVVNPDAHDARIDHSLAEYARERGVDRLADFELFLIRFGLVDAKGVTPTPQFTPGPALPRFPGLPPYATDSVRWTEP
jgi:hypothetical protein